MKHRSESKLHEITTPFLKIKSLLLPSQEIRHPQSRLMKNSHLDSAGNKIQEI